MLSMRFFTILLTLFVAGVSCRPSDDCGDDTVEYFRGRMYMPFLPECSRFYNLLNDGKSFKCIFDKESYEACFGDYYDYENDEGGEGEKREVRSFLDRVKSYLGINRATASTKKEKDAGRKGGFIDEGGLTAPKRAMTFRKEKKAMTFRKEKKAITHGHEEQELEDEEELYLPQRQAKEENEDEEELYLPQRAMTDEDSEDLPKRKRNNKKARGKKKKPRRKSISGEISNPTKFLETYGYLPKHKKGVVHDKNIKKKAIKKFQKMYHLKQSGSLDADTANAMFLRPRCGFPDAVPIVDATQPLSYVAPGFKWSKTDLTWKLHNYWAEGKLDNNTQLAAIKKAFKFWSDVTKLTFTQTTGPADINLKFAFRNHGDGVRNAFDGPSGVLAHAYFPESGELHYDAEEYWTDNELRGINLMIVSAHEIGHAIGLSHSEIPGTLMAPYYQGFEENFALRPDDIEGAQHLYGANDQDTPIVPEETTSITTTPTSTTTTTTTTIKPADPSGLCSLEFQAVAQTHDQRVNIFIDDQWWRVSDYGLDPGFPKRLSEAYQKPPSKVDAAVFSWRTYYTYLFNEEEVWVYYGYQLVTRKNIKLNRPQAAFVKHDAGTVHLLKDGYIYDWNERSFEVQVTQPRYFWNEFPNSPTSFNTLFKKVTDPNLYFFSGDQYFKYTPHLARVAENYPRPSNAWMGKHCGYVPYSPKK